MFASTSEWTRSILVTNTNGISSPEVLYNSVANNEDRLAKIKNTTLFFEDLEADKLPQWLFISTFSSPFQELPLTSLSFLSLLPHLTIIPSQDILTNKIQPPT